MSPVRLFVPAVLAALSSMWSPASAAGDALAGRDMARQWCSSCHVVEPGGRGSDAAPTFAALANRPGAGPERWRTWLANPHPPMPKLQLSRQTIADITDSISP